MGSEIVYCRACQERLVGRDFEQGRAFRADDGVYCKPCAPAELKAPAPLKAAPTARRIAARRAAAAPSRAPLIAGIAGALLAVVALVAIASSGTSAPRESPPPAPPPPPAPAPTPVAKPGPPAPVASRPAATAALDKARDHRRTSPADLEGQMRLFTEAVFAAEGTPLLAEAKKELEEVRRGREAVEQKAREAKAREPAKRPPPLIVYQDGLGKGFINGSWKSKIDYKAKRPGGGEGKCVSFEPQGAWAGLYIQTPNLVDGSQYTTLAFSARATQDGQKLTLSVYPEGENKPRIVPLSELGGWPAAGEWKSYVVPLERLGAAGKKCKGFVLQDGSGGAQPPVYVDNIRFE